MNIDIIFLAIIGISVLFAFFRGFVASLLSLIAWILSLTASFFLREKGATLLEAYIANPMIAELLAGSGIFFISLIVLGIINGQILEQTREIRLGAVDRTLGAAFGLGRGVLVVMGGVLLIMMVSTLIAPQTEEDGREGKELQAAAPEWLANSQSYPLIHVGLEWILEGVSPRYFKNIRKTLAGAQEQFLLSSSGKDIDLSALSDPKIMDKLVQQLPKAEREKLYASSQKNGKNTEDADIGRAQFALSVLSAYRRAVNEKKIHGEPLPQNTLTALELAVKRQLQDARAGSATDKGYQEKQVYQFDDLIHQLEPSKQP